MHRYVHTQVDANGRPCIWAFMHMCVHSQYVHAEEGSCTGTFMHSYVDAQVRPCTGTFLKIYVHVLVFMHRDFHAKVLSCICKFMRRYIHAHVRSWMGMLMHLYFPAQVRSCTGNFMHRCLCTFMYVYVHVLCTYQYLYNNKTLDLSNFRFTDIDPWNQTIELMIIDYRKYYRAPSSDK